MTRYIGLCLVALCATLVFVFSRNSFYLDLAILVGINAIVCIGLNLLIGYAGQISLGHAAFFAIGAYAPALLAMRTGLPALAAIAITAAITAAFAFGLARPILRLRGHYLAMVTLSVGMVVSIVINTETKVTGGADGLNIPALTVIGWTVSGERAWFWVVVVALMLTILISLNLIDSPAGRALQAVRGSEFAARASGIDTQRVKSLVFVLSAVMASLAGSMFAYYVGFVTPALGGFLKSIEFVAMVVLGGMASVYGAVVGALLLTLLPHMLTALENYELAVFGGIMVLTMAVMPRGIVPTLSQILSERRA